MGGRAAANPHRTAKRLGAAGAALVVLAVVLAGLGAFLRQAAIDSAVNDAATFDAPGEQMISGGMGEQGLWVEDPKSTSQFDVSIEDETGPVPYRPFGLFGSSSELEIDGVTYRLDGEFTPQRNTFMVGLAERDDVGDVEPLKVAIGPPDGYDVPTSTVIAGIGAVLALLAGGALLALGLVLTLVGRRRGTEAAPPSPTAPSPPTSF